MCFYTTALDIWPFVWVVIGLIIAAAAAYH